MEIRDNKIKMKDERRSSYNTPAKKLYMKIVEFMDQMGSIQQTATTRKLCGTFIKDLALSSQMKLKMKQPRTFKLN